MVGTLFALQILCKMINNIKKKLNGRAVENPGEKGGSFDSSGAFHDSNNFDDQHYGGRREQSNEVSVKGFEKLIF